MGNAEKGRSYTSTIAGYMIVKSILNLVLGFGMGNVIGLVINVALAAGMHKGIKLLNYAVAVFLAVVMLKNVKANIDGQQWLYLAEGIIDLLCAAALIVSRDIRAHFG